MLVFCFLSQTDVISDLRPRSMDGVVDSGISLNGDISSSPDCDFMQNQQVGLFFIFEAAFFCSFYLIAFCGLFF